MTLPTLELELAAEPAAAPTAGPLTAAAYARMLVALLPPGRLWRLTPASYLWKLFLAAGDELARIDQRGIDLVREADPRTADELLSEHEADYGLAAEGTLEQRRARVVAHEIARQRVRPVDFQQALAPLLGQAAEDVVVLERTRAFAIAVDDDREIYRFFIYRDPAEPGSYDLAAAQALVDRMAQSHTKGHVIESDDFLCDDEFSLCDRDILGA